MDDQVECLFMCTTNNNFLPQWTASNLLCTDFNKWEKNSYESNAINQNKTRQKPTTGTLMFIGKVHVV